MRFVLLVLLFTSSALAECRQGYDILGLAKQDVGMIAQEIRPNSVIGVLEGTFGPVIPSLTRLIQTGKVCAFRAHLRDGTCWRNKKCPKGTPSLHELTYLGKLAQSFQALSDRTQVPCYLSAVLEHDEKDAKKVQAWIDVIRRHAPSCTPVISAFSGVFLPGILKEKHGNDSRADIVSNDGVSLYDADTSHYWSHGSLFSLGWIHRFNLRTSGEKTFVPPLQRKAKATRLDIQTVSKLMAPVPPKPALSGNLKEVKSPLIWKTAAEDYNNGDSRANKIVFLTKEKVSQFDLISQSGKKIGCLKRFDPAFEGLNRYYLGSCSKINNLQLMDLAGSEWLFAKSGKHHYLVNAIRRLGRFR